MSIELKRIEKNKEAKNATTQTKIDLAQATNVPAQVNIT